VKFTRATLGYPEYAIRIPRFFLRHAHWDSRPERAESDISDVWVAIEFDHRDSMRQTRIRILVVDHPRKIELHAKSKLFQYLIEQAILLKAISTACLNHDSPIQRFDVQRQVVAEPRPNTAEGKSRYVATRDVAQEREVWVASFQL